LWYAIAIIILMLCVVLVAQQVMVTSLRRALDERLHYDTQIVAAAIINSPPETSDEAKSLIKSLTEQQFYYLPALLRICDPKHNVLATFGEVPEIMVPMLDRQLLLPELEEGRFENVTIRDEEALRIYTVPVRDPSNEKTIALVQTGDSLASVGTAQRQLWQYALAVGIVGSLAAILVGLFIVQRGFRPLEAIMRQVQDIRSGNLKVEFPDEPRPPELQQLANTLNDVMQRLDKAFKTREVFIASVSHDLKTPLTVLKGQIDVLLMQPSADEETRQSLERMAREVRILVRMSNNLLLNAQLESKPALVPREVDLRALLDEVLGETRVLADGVELQVSAPEGVIVPGDYDLLKQMVLNVVDNAIKFTPKGSAIRLTLGEAEEYAIIEVADTGRGIPQEHLGRITEPFYKVDASRRFGAGGVGLGLAIVRQVIDLHSGQLDITSEEKVGTTVTMRLPLALPSR
jgi:signal transduction histidine kinase